MSGAGMMGNGAVPFEPVVSNGDGVWTPGPGTGVIPGVGLVPMPRVPAHSTESLRNTGRALTMRPWWPARTTEVLDTLWRFSAERFAVYVRRLRGLPSPWTLDPTLQRFRFTNTYRASDRVSQFLIKDVIYGEELSPEDTFFRIILFKLFNRVETWKRLEQTVGPPQWKTYRFERYESVLSSSLARGEPIYSAAYIIPSPRLVPFARKHASHLRLLEAMMADRTSAALARARRMKDVFKRLRSYSGLGDFLAYQYAIDINYSELTDFSESEFVVPGPGARDGIRKCFPSLGGLAEAEIVRLLHERQEDEFALLGLPAVTLWGRRLQLVDCQNLLCEVGKYARVAHPDVPGRSGRTRIKQRYRFSGSLPAPWFPPKWHLNGLVSDWMEHHERI